VILVRAFVSRDCARKNFGLSEMSGCKWAAALGAVIVSVSAQQQDAEPQECFTSGNIVGAVIGTIVILALLAAACYAFWKYYWTRRQDGEHEAPICAHFPQIKRFAKVGAASVPANPSG
jgi:hypothetical protein